VSFAWNLTQRQSQLQRQIQWNNPTHLVRIELADNQPDVLILESLLHAEILSHLHLPMQERDRRRTFSCVVITEMLRARDVWDEQEEKKSQRMTAMRPVMAQLEAKIRTHAIQQPNAPYLLFEVPTFVFGYPLYPLKDAMDFLTAELHRAGYWVWPVEEKYLLVSWLKPVKTRDLGRPILTTNYRPQVYDPTFLPR
jgi:hypothetical protein